MNRINIIIFIMLSCNLYNNNTLASSNSNSSNSSSSSTAQPKLTAQEVALKTKTKEIIHAITTQGYSKAAEQYKASSPSTFYYVALQITEPSDPQQRLDYLDNLSKEINKESLSQTELKLLATILEKNREKIIKAHPHLANYISHPSKVNVRVAASSSSPSAPQASSSSSSSASSAAEAGKHAIPKLATPTSQAAPSSSSSSSSAGKNAAAKLATPTSQAAPSSSSSSSSAGKNAAAKLATPAPRVAPSSSSASAGKDAAAKSGKESSTPSAVKTAANVPQFSFPKVEGEEKIPFPRENLLSEYSPIYGQHKLEGYWASSADPREDEYKGKYPFPKANQLPWPGKDAFLKKLTAIEAIAQKKDINLMLKDFRAMREGVYKANIAEKNLIVIMRGRAYAPSRIDGSRLGDGEFFDYKTKIMWPYCYSWHYIEEHNIIPSREFYRYVMNLDLAAYTPLPKK